MAQLKNKYFGELKGKLGDVVFRQRGKNNYIAQHPRSYKKPQNPEYFNRVKTFVLSTKFASVINSIGDLKFCWDKKKSNSIPMFNYLVSVLYSNLKLPESAHLVKITPERGFGLRVKSVSINETNFEINIEPLGNDSGINTSEETKIRLINILWLFDPISSSNQENEFTKFITMFEDLNINQNIIFNVNFSSNITELLKLYTKLRIYSTLITYSDELIQLNYSNTYFSELSLR
jgi:hypothetical protein